MSSSDYQVHLAGKQIESLWDDDGFDLPPCHEEDIDKVIQEEMATLRKRRRRRRSTVS